jgi:hypothetical protein
MADGVFNRGGYELKRVGQALFSDKVMVVSFDKDVLATLVL